MTEAASEAVTPIMYGAPLKFHPKLHRYEWQGTPVPGVTSILRRLAKPALIQWAADMACKFIIENCQQPVEGYWTVGAGDLDAARLAHAQMRDAAGSVGKDVHTYAEDLLSGRNVALPEDDTVRRAVSAFGEWRAKHDIEPLALERRVLSKRWFYAGTTDFFGKIDGRMSVLDFKTSSAIYDEMWLQTMAYEIALREELGLDRNAEIVRWIVRLDKKTGKFEAVDQGYSAAHEDAWLHLVELNKVLSRMERQQKESANGIRAQRRKGSRA